ncbi:ParA family protein [Listeria booriae]|uniref:ParA family protein n=1 Tax=Listeria booriae TaxID=1552123 RepID=UPI001628926D|nr:ParA family protein [Listeria booriae]MBC1920478.1 ParA family protein [Listeria booriae]
MSSTITFTNRKGGVGKTIGSSVFATYLSAIKGKKVLFVDLDPQGNATTILVRTFGFTEDYYTYDEGLEKGDLKPFIVSISENMDILPAGRDLADFVYILFEKFPGRRNKLLRFYLDSLLEPLKESYDYIIIDTPPTEGPESDNAIYASDFIVVPMQYKEFAVSGTVELQEEIDDNADTAAEVLAVVPQIIKMKATAERMLKAEAKESLGDLLTEHAIYDRDRVEGWAIEGIKYKKELFSDHHDRVTWEMYEAVNEELLERLSEYVI